jgi:serine/threonine protein kinase
VVGTSLCANCAILSCCLQVIVDKGYHGATVDLWSCGVILFVLMAGYLPFDDPNLLNLYRKVHEFCALNFPFSFYHGHRPVQTYVRRTGAWQASVSEN